MNVYSSLTISLFAILNIENSYSQPKDSITNIQLDAIEVKAYFQKQLLKDVTSAAQLLSQQQLQQQYGNNIVTALNTVPGMRMEERSPGSYRLSIRGNILRSPFGIRNIKIYMDEFPLTDAGGNTYFNVIDPQTIASITVLKGPDGSLFGANTGGVLKITPMGLQEQQPQNQFALTYGSFRTLQQRLLINQQPSERYSYSFSQNYSRSEGYRAQSAMEKLNFHTAHNWKYSKYNALKLYSYYTDLAYETPGGLTLAQYQENPRMARPAAGTTPSAETQQAGIKMKSFYTGIAHSSQLTRNFSHEFVLFTNINHIENPFITNYEYRKEANVGLRTFINYKQSWNEQLQWESQAGVEYQKGWFHITNRDNLQGKPTGLQAEDKLQNMQYFLFVRNALYIGGRTRLEASVSYNENAINVQQQFPTPSLGAQQLRFQPTWMPRFAASYRAFDNLTLRAVLAKGFSAPTIAEVRSSTNAINTALQAEEGTNYEIGSRIDFWNKWLTIDVAAYRYDLKQGIVRQLDAQGNEYFQNAGRIAQKGLEVNLTLNLVKPRNSGAIRSWSLNSAWTLQDYRFKSYQVDRNNFSGNDVTAVPKKNIVNQMTMQFSSFGAYLLHQYTSKMPMNDANTVYANSVNIMTLKGDWKINLSGKRNLLLHAQIANIFNEKYSLGNDINAFGGRYYNPAATRNYTIGLSTQF
ncbi:TonB-dependent receptor [Sphingobacteriaceae bacterium WQ 2009]|uniref:TonB-dependent receptor n=1 Tax=Rhinopithecimicrobium faecis TaxID=2820698 RepID=A0A8T4HBQ6_9SPHI|nr:TonB-dependent receptor [Sphingobacteriaceae bacterium WQ 2009]